MTQLALMNAEGTAPAERGCIHVHFGDWREAEPTWPRPFVYVTDPPFGVRAKSNFKRNGTRALAQGIVGDDDTAQRDAMLAVDGWQAAAVFGPGGAKLLRVPPWGSPLALNVAKAPPGLPIVDPFMGSGTTAVACALLGREFYGAEIDPQYWPVIRGRLSAVGVVLP